MADLVLSQLRHMVQSFDTTRSHTRIFPKTYEDVIQVRKQMEEVLVVLPHVLTNAAGRITHISTYSLCNFF